MDIAIIGAGPRGLSVAERLVARSIETKTQLNIRIFDPYSIGGRVWDPDIPYNKFMLMNTVTSQVSLFVDNSIENPGLIVRGPNMYEWIVSDANAFISSRPEFEDYRSQLSLGANDFATRGLMGVYALWFFQRTLERMPNNVSLRYIKDEVVDIDKTKGQIKLTTKNPDNTWVAENVIMGLGYSENKLSKEEAEFAKFAKVNDLTYLAPNWPAEAPLDLIPAKEPVIIRGLGLTFFDYMAQLTQGRGGKFTRNASGELTYKKNGKEPLMFVGSRDGMPTHARGINKKESTELYQPMFFTIDNLDKLRDSKTKNISYDDFFALLNKEMQYKHYLNVTDDPTYRDTLSKGKEMLSEMEGVSVEEFEQIARNHNVPEEQIWNWDRVLRASHSVPKNKDLNKWFLSYLKFDIEDARKNNISAPYAGAFDILRDVRDSIRYIVEHGYFNNENYEKFNREFSLVNSLLSVGPPLERMEQLRALIKAGIITILGPEVSVTTQTRGKVFVATSKRGEKIKAKALVEARLPRTNIKTSEASLQKNLLSNGWVKPAVLKKGKKNLTLGAIDINRDTFHFINKQGKSVNNIYSYGLPHEGLKWFETVIPRPGVNTVILREASQIANLIFDKIEAKNKKK